MRAAQVLVGLGLLLMACADSHGRRRRASEADAAPAVDAETADANDVLTSCRTTCDAPALIGRYDGGFDARVWAVLDAARIGSVLGVLVMRQPQDADPNRDWYSYGLLRFELTTGEATLTNPVETFLVDNAMVGGALVAREARFEAIVLRSSARNREDGVAEVGRLVWSVNGALLHADDVGSLSAPLAPCRDCTRLGGVFAAGDEAIVGVAHGDGVQGGLVNLGDGRLRELGQMVSYPGERRDTVPLSGVVLTSNQVAVVGGGGRRIGQQTEAYAAWGPFGGAPLVAVRLPGDEADPPPAIGSIDDAPVAWRYVSDPSDILAGAIVGWRLGRDGALGEIARIPTALGLFPSDFIATEGTHGTAALVWAERPTGSGAELRVLFADAALCSTAVPHTPLVFPQPPYATLEQGRGGLAVTADEAGTFVVAQGVDDGGITTAFMVPNCRLERTAER
ncbi:MAG: hypothetical protein IT379_22235 [Deltaproteobacteria bacterium]|nr:hypothetical protein [Deltaproteobacteria bacterium]